MVSRHPTRNAAYASTSPAVADFSAGQMIRIDSGANMASAVIATVGTAGATTVSTANTTGATLIPVASRLGFTAGQTITIDSVANQETTVVATAFGGGRQGARITLAAPLTLGHAAAAQVSGFVITLTAPLARAEWPALQARPSW